MVEKNLGFIFLDAAPKTENGVLPGVFQTQQDTYAFRTGTTTANVNVSASFSGGSTQLALFRDNNANGRLDNVDSFLSPGTTGTTFLSLNKSLGKGNFIARVQGISGSNMFYTFKISRSSPGSANPLTTPEIQLGTIAQDLRRRDRISDQDTADNFAFTLDGNSSLNIAVRELGNQKGDANIRVVQDRNGNGSVDQNEVVVKGTSTLKGNLDTITGLRGAGDYILQVCQSSGNTQFGVTFDHSAA
ncbi:hypothetical protein [Leptolyngbya sp. 7M]|uniref:hypothetical protein n=1 Tax=Leptolyngbya sp. 7M TaxID=2812896 RepID=UPI001B8CA1DF|nr:hypothetical protein [Leptolyngbya sp. 7M]QYO68285.1 hypothetical protein JVX88_16860 [Leptolyngbya sp. 7M]